MKKILTYVSFLTVLLGSLPVFSQVTNVPAEHPSVMRGVRPLGMGNAFVGMKGSDENAQFYNPAAINDYEKKLHFRFLSPTFDFSPGVITLIKDTINLKDDINGKTNSQKITNFNTFISQRTGKFESASIRMPLVMVMHKWFSASLLMDSHNTVAIRDGIFDAIEVSSISDAGVVVGGAYGFFEEALQAGLNIKVLHRLAIEQVITSSDIVRPNVNFGDLFPRNRATGVGVDLGLKGSIPTFGITILETLKPSAGFTWQDIGNTRFSGVVPDTKQSITVGFALHPEWKNWKFHFVNDLREMNQTGDLMKKWHIGAEVQAPTLLGFFSPAIRVGGNQGYFTAGTTLDFRYAKLEFAYYGEEAGEFSSSKKLNRLAFNLSFGL